MRTKNPDVVVVGAGIAGASIAAVLARGGLEVLLLERQRAYRDRVRGKYMAPWGVLEARAAGLETVIRGARAVDARYSVPYDELVTPSAAEAAKGDASTILPGVCGPLCASHPQACQALADEAVRLGAKLVGGVTEVRVQAGTRPSVTYLNGTEMQVRPRLIIGADGRTSTVRKQSGIHINRAPASHVIAGLLVEGTSRWPADQFSIGVEGDLQFYVFPQGGGRLRLYTCHANEQAARWAGRAGPQRFLQAFAGLRSIPAARGLGGATAAGPCATFSGEQTWCEEPYAAGVVLLGDAGGYDDPVDGQGLSLALRDVRQLSELLLATGDWTAAALRPYGQQRAERLRRMRRVSLTFAALMTTFTADGRARRSRYYVASRARREDIKLALGAIHLGPDRLPIEAFSDQLHESLLASHRPYVNCD
jgi:menaquinone-9 beta-reductase